MAETDIEALATVHARLIEIGSNTSAAGQCYATFECREFRVLITEDEARALGPHLYRWCLVRIEVRP